MNDFVFWRYSEVTKDLLQELDSEIKRIEEEILSGDLIVSPALDREYCSATGELRGLKFILKYIENRQTKGELESE